MRDFRDAKAMAQTLRESLTTKAVTISHSESLELVSRMLGVADWTTLSASRERVSTIRSPTIRSIIRRIDSWIIRDSSSPG